MSGAERNAGDASADHLASAAKIGNLPQLKEDIARLPKCGFERSRLLRKALLAASTGNQPDIVAYLIDQENCTTDHAAALVALTRRHFAVLDVLQSRGWDINAPFQGGNTLSILYIAMLKENTLRWCLDHGADPAMRSVGRNNQLLAKAGWLASLSSLKILKEYGADFAKSNALHEAAQRRGTPKRLEIMTWLLDEAGVDINQREWCWDEEYTKLNGTMGFMSALQCAVQAGQVENVQFLLDRGADLERKDTIGRRAVEMTAKVWFIETLERYYVEHA